MLTDIIKFIVIFIIYIVIRASLIAYYLKHGEKVEVARICATLVASSTVIIMLLVLL